MQRVPDPYRVLGLDRDATSVEIRAAHRRLAKRFHPDATHADGARFLAVQDAYELLRDPLRRRDWDRRHALGPVRAASTGTARGTHAPSPGGRRQRAPGPTSPAAAGARSGARPASPDATFGPNDRPQHADHWTWTADGVPWWEDGGAPRARRERARRRAAGGDTAAPGPTAPTRPDSTEDAATSRRSTNTTSSGRTTAGARRPRAAPPPPPTDNRHEFDVYSRSSGAAWSSASRAYFRRAGAEMPSGAAEPNTPRWTTPVGASPPPRYRSAGDAIRSARPAPTPATATDRGPGAATPDDSQPVARRDRTASPRLGAALAALFRRRAALPPEDG